METTIEAVEAPATDEIIQTNGAETEVAEEVTEEIQEPKPVDESKKAANRISRLERTIGKKHAEMMAERDRAAKLEAELASYRQNPRKDNAPREEDFDNYGEFLKAQAKFEIQQEFKQRDEQSTKKQTDLELVREFQTANEKFDAEEATLSKALPDYQAFVNDMEDFDQLPTDKAQVIMRMAQKGTPILAAYTLWKEGRIDEVASLPLHEFTMEIAKAELRGSSHLAPKVTSAPTPMAAAKGTGKPSKDINNMTVSELMKWRKS